MKKSKEDLELQIAFELAEFFKDEPHKIALWLLSKNFNFGGCSPAELIVIREKAGLEKVAKFILRSKEENSF
jgi:hypothetical protein